MISYWLQVSNGKYERKSGWHLHAHDGHQAKRDSGTLPGLLASVPQAGTGGWLSPGGQGHFVPTPQKRKICSLGPREDLGGREDPVPCVEFICWDTQNYMKGRVDTFPRTSVKEGETCQVNLQIVGIPILPWIIQSIRILTNWVSVLLSIPVFNLSCYRTIKTSFNLFSQIQQTTGRLHFAIHKGCSGRWRAALAAQLHPMPPGTIVKPCL